MKPPAAHYLDELPTRVLVVALALWLALNLAYSLWVQPRLTQEEKPRSVPVQGMTPGRSAGLEER